MAMQPLSMDIRRGRSPSPTLSGVRLYHHRARTPTQTIPEDPTETALTDEPGTSADLKEERRNPISDKRRQLSSGYTSDEVFAEERTPLLQPKLKRRRSTDSVVSMKAVDDIEDPQLQSMEMSRKPSLFNTIKVAVLVALTLTCCAFIIINPELEMEYYQIVVSERQPQAIVLGGTEKSVVEFSINAPVLASDTTNISGDTGLTLLVGAPKLTIRINDTEPWVLFLDEKALKTGNQHKFSHKFECCSSTGGDRYELLFETNSKVPIPVVFSYCTLNMLVKEQVIFAAIILICVYVLIVFDLVHRALAAILGSMAAIAVLSALNERPTLEEIMSWLDVQTLGLLFGMMILVSIFSETGFFDYCALLAYKLARGKVWPLITILCIFSAVVSAFLDNVTTILLLTPVTIRLCEVLNLDPKNILIAEVLFSNIGGTATAIGDPPNVIIVSNKDLSERGINFSSFTEHMLLGIIFVTIAGYGLLRLFYRDIKLLENQDPPETSEMKHEIELWRRAAMHISVATREESMVKALLLQKVATLETLLKNNIFRKKVGESRDFRANVAELEKKYRITDYVLLAKSGVVILLVILAFFLHSFIEAIHVGLGWIAIMGATLLLVAADISELESILHRVEWATLLFFAALFSLMQALGKLGLIDWIGEGMGTVISMVDDQYRMTVAIISILWISALASSFIDNIPYTTAMVPVLVKLSDDQSLDLPLLPLVLALAFGACLGGNGTLIGASANVVCAGIAEQHGYGFTFMEFFKIGFPMMLMTTVVSTAYLIICHVAFQWH